jgi:hypothetical protein
MISFKSFLMEKQFNQITLYHGQPSYEKNFESFHDREAFFADKARFAIEYAEQKAFEQVNDADIYLYTCTFTGNLFYIWNNER